MPLPTALIRTSHSIMMVVSLSGVKISISSWLFWSGNFTSTVTSILSPILNFSLAGGSLVILNSMLVGGVTDCQRERSTMILALRWRPHHITATTKLSWNITAYRYDDYNGNRWWSRSKRNYWRWIRISMYPMKNFTGTTYIVRLPFSYRRSNICGIRRAGFVSIIRSWQFWSGGIYIKWSTHSISTNPRSHLMTQVDANQELSREIRNSYSLFWRVCAWRLCPADLLCCTLEKQWVKRCFMIQNKKLTLSVDHEGSEIICLYIWDLLSFVFEALDKNLKEINKKF